MGWRKGGSVVLSGEVRRALEAGKAVVALESTIIAHGMPYPQNLATAQRLEEIVRYGRERCIDTRHSERTAVRVLWSS